MFKKLAIIAGLSVLVAFALPTFAGDAKGKGKGLETASGQHKDPHGQDSKARFEKLCKDLELTNDQPKKAKPIWDDTDKKMKASRGDKSLSATQKGEKEKAVHDEGMKKFRMILRPDQQKKLDAMKTESKAKAKAKAAHEHGKGDDKKAEKK